MLEEDRDLREIDPGDAVLLGERAQRVDLLDRAVVDELRRQRGGRAGSLLRAERRVELLLRHELALKRILPSGRFSSLEDMVADSLTVRARRIGTTSSDRPPDAHRDFRCHVSRPLDRRRLAPSRASKAAKRARSIAARAPATSSPYKWRLWSESSRRHRISPAR